jgi:hypothetical protein
VAVSQTVWRLCEGYFSFRGLGPTAVKGIDIGGNSASPDTPRFTRSSLDSTSSYEFVGRLFGSGLSAHVHRPDSSVLESTR